MRRGQEPGLVHDEVVQAPPGGPLGTHEQPDVGVVRYLDGLPREPDPGGDHCSTGTIVGREQETLSALPGVVVIDLQCKRGLATVHRAVEELQVRRHRERPSVSGRGYGCESAGSCVEVGHGRSG
jgi:hypothetical protein